MIPEDMVCVIGYVKLHGLKSDGFPHITNCVAVIQNKKIVGEYDKVLLANGNHHEDRKYFEPGQLYSYNSNTNSPKINGVFTVQLNGEYVKIGVPICEDIWVNDHNIDIVSEMIKAGAEYICITNQSYFHYTKLKDRYSLLENYHYANPKVTFIYVNCIGVGDIVKNIMIFDGASFCIGKKYIFAKQFEAGLFCDQSINPHNFDKFDQIYKALVFEQKELFDVCGLKKAQVHVSGGIDSAIVATIVSKAMGKENTILITNPSGSNGDKLLNMVRKLSDSLEVPFYTQKMGDVIEKYTDAFMDGFKINNIENPTVIGTAHAVGRTVAGLMASNHFKTGIVATGNHTEIVEGWANFHDIGSIGVHAILGDLTKSELFILSDFINKKFGQDIIPKELYDNSHPDFIPPAAELPDSSVDPYDYWVTSGIDAELIRNRKSPNQIIKDFINHTLTIDFFPNDFNNISIYDRITVEKFSEAVKKSFWRSKISVFKAAQGAPVVIISPRSRGFSNRETIINHWQG